MEPEQTLSEEELSCPVCFSVFTDPVILSCSHSFCKVCIGSCWEHKTVQECPVCTKTSTESEPVCNLALRNLCEAFVKQRSRTASELVDLCSVHGEKLKLFCLVDKQPICVDCLTEAHNNHKFCSTAEAVKPHKEKLKNALSDLEDKHKVFCKFMGLCNETTAHIKSQSEHAEQQIKKEFEELHQFLKDEEAVRIAKLREEEDEKTAAMSKVMKEMNKVSSSLTATISAVTELLATDNISFLKNKDKIHSITCPAQDPELPSGALLNVAQHLGSLKYKVWEKMVGIVQYVPVTLDPNTANPKLILSDDLTSINTVGDSMKIPDVPERFTAYEGVLGSEGFSSGNHCWDVDVGDNENWVLGIAKQSNKRKVKCLATPENGFWALFSDGCKIAYMLQGKQVFLKNKKCKQIRVQLDWEKGLLSFYDLNNQVNLHTFKQRFNETVFPYFYTCRNEALKIQPTVINISKANQPCTSGTWTYFNAIKGHPA